MATRFQKILWTILCGGAVGIVGCGESDPGPDAEDDMIAYYGPPPDYAVDTEADTTDTLGDVVEEDVPDEGPAPAYGPAVDS